MADDLTPHKRCPACGSETLARMHRTWWQRMASWMGETKKYRCLFCGYEFLERTRISETEKDGESESPPPADSEP